MNSLQFSELVRTRRSVRDFDSSRDVDEAVLKCVLGRHNCMLAVDLLLYRMHRIQKCSFSSFDLVCLLPSLHRPALVVVVVFCFAHS